MDLKKTVWDYAEKFVKQQYITNKSKFLLITFLVIISLLYVNAGTVSGSFEDFLTSGSDLNSTVDWTREGKSNGGWINLTGTKKESVDINISDTAGDWNYKSDKKQKIYDWVGHGGLETEKRVLRVNMTDVDMNNTKAGIGFQEFNNPDGISCYYRHRYNDNKIVRAIDDDYVGNAASLDSSIGSGDWVALELEYFPSNGNWSCNYKTKFTSGWKTSDTQSDGGTHNRTIWGLADIQKSGGGASGDNFQRTRFHAITLDKDLVEPKGNNAPTVKNIDPSSGSLNVNDTSSATGFPGVDVNVSYTAKDSDNSTLSWAAILWKNNTVIYNKSSPSEGSKIKTIIDNLAAGTKYEWQAAVSDGIATSYAGNYSFTTEVKSAESSELESTNLKNDVLNFPFNDTSGSTFNDYSGFNNDGSIYGVTLGAKGITKGEGDWNSGKSGDWDGADDNVNVSSSAALNITDNLTISVWVKADSWDSNDFNTILSKEANTAAYELQGPGNNNDQIAFVLGSGSSYYAAKADWGGNVPTNEWIHIVARYSQAESQAVYVNGENWTNTSDGFSGTIAKNTEDVSIGHKNGARHFDGQIDELKVFNRTLSEAEIGNLRKYNTLNPPNTIEITASKISNRTYFNRSLTFTGSLSENGNLTKKVDGSQSQVCSNCKSFTLNIGSLDTGFHTLILNGTDYDDAADTQKNVYGFFVNKTFSADSYNEWVGVKKSKSNVTVSNGWNSIFLPDSKNAGQYTTDTRSWNTSLGINKLILSGGRWSNFNIQEKDILGGGYLDPFFFANSSMTNNYRMTVLDTSASEVDYYISNDSITWTKKADNIIGSNPPSCGVRTGGQYYIYTTPNGSAVNVWTGSGLESLTKDSTVAIDDNIPDPGCFYNKSSGTFHLYSEGPLNEHGCCSSDNITHWTSSNGVDFTEQSIIFEDSTLGKGVGDISVQVIDGKIYMFTDISEDHPKYRIGMLTGDSPGDQFSFAGNVTETTNSGDIEVRLQADGTGFTGLAEYCADTSDNGICRWNSTGLFDSGTKVRIESDSNDDGVLDEDTGKLSTSASYSVKEQPTILSESVSVGSYSLSGSYAHRLTFYFKDSSQPSVGSFSLTSETNSPPSVSNLVVSPDPVYAGNTVNGTADVSDPESNLWGVFADYVLPNGTLIADNVSMNQADANTWYLSQHIPNSSGSVGTADFNVRAYDGQGGSDTASTTFEVKNSTAKEPKSIVKKCPASPFCWLTSGVSNFFRQLSAATTGFTPKDVVSPAWDVNTTGTVGRSYNVSVIVNSTNPSVSTVESNRIQVDIISSSTNSAPSADFDYKPSQPSTLDDVKFNGSLSSDTDGTIQSYSWEVNDDGTEDYTVAEPVHNYSSSGNYTVDLTVTDDDGATDTVTKTVEVTSGGSSDGGSGGGGGSGGTNDTSSSSSGNNYVAVLAPHTDAKYTGIQSFELATNESRTITVASSEHTFELEQVQDTDTAVIRVDGGKETIQQDGYTEVEGQRVYARAITTNVNGFDTNGTIFMQLLNTEGLAKYDTYHRINYSINSSGTIELLRREAGYGNQYSVIKTWSPASAENNTYKSFLQQKSAGLYEVKARLNTSGTSISTAPVGYYVSRAPKIQIQKPANGQTILATGDQYGPFEAPLDYRVETDRAASMGQYYVQRSSGKQIFNFSRDNYNVVDGQQDGLVEDIRQSFLVDYLAALDPLYGGFWQFLSIPESYIVEIDTTAYLPKTGSYTAYANASSNATGYNFTLTSLGRTITVKRTFPGDNNYTDYVASRDTDTDNTLEKSNVTNTSVGDVNGDGKTDYYYNAWLHIFSPNNGKEYTVTDLSSASVTLNYDFVANKSGLFKLNKTIIVNHTSKDVKAEKQLNPLRTSYNTVFKGSDFSSGQWTTGTYTVYGKTLYPNGSTIQTVKLDRYTFTVQQAGFVKLISRWFDPAITGLSTVYDTTKIHAQWWLAFVVTIGLYLGFRYQFDHFYGLVTAGISYITFAYIGYFGTTTSLAVAGIVSFFLARKLFRGDVRI